MVAGIPGAGIGGLFYLLSAFTLPFRMAARWLRGERGAFRSRESWMLVLLALGVVAGIWATGWMLGAIIVHGPGLTRGASPLRHGLPGISTNVIRVAALLGGFITLGVVIGVADFGALALARSRARAAGRSREAL